jgi:hypothetical protein
MQYSSHWIMSFLPFNYLLSRGIDHRSDIIYHSIRKHDLMLDIYWHKDTHELQKRDASHGPAPVFMYVHGKIILFLSVCLFVSFVSSYIRLS